MNIVLIGQGSVKIELCNKNKIKGLKFGDLSTADGKTETVSSNFVISDYIRVNSLEYNTLSKSTTSQMVIYTYDENKKYITFDAKNQSEYTFKTAETVKYLRFRFASTTLNINAMLEVNSAKTDYIEHQEDSRTLNIQQEMLLNDKFEYDENTKKWYEVHNWGKYKFTGNENFVKASEGNLYYLAGSTMFNYNIEDLETVCNIANCLNDKTIISANTAYSKLKNNQCALRYDSTTRAIYFKYSEVNTLEEFKAIIKDKYIYYKTKTKLECTAEQTEVLNYLTNKIKTYKNITNITTDSIALIDATYKKDRETTDNNFQKQIDELKALLSTTKTSAMLLDNLQSDLESEVM